MDRKVSCTLARGSVAVLGTGQGVSCGSPDTDMPPSAAQVYLPGPLTCFGSCLSMDWPE